MKKILADLLILSAAAAAPLAARAAEKGDDAAVRRCLDAWGEKQPFKGKELPKYRVLAANVKVMGIGGNTADTEATKDPALVLVKPSVAVMSKQTLKLTNPNGWYCLKANVTVMAKTVLEVGCATKVADSNAGVAVLGSNDAGTGHGVTVLGKTELKRVGCPAKK